LSARLTVPSNRHSAPGGMLNGSSSVVRKIV
jgi:hypothetical protein